MSFCLIRFDCLLCLAVPPIKDDTTAMASDAGVSVRHSLVDIYRLMLMIWCRESLALRRLKAHPPEAAGNDPSAKETTTIKQSAKFLLPPSAF